MILLLWAVAMGAQAQEAGRVYGTIIDLDTHKPVPFVSVSVVDSRIGAAADSVGYFQILGLKAGMRILEFRRVGYVTARETVIVSHGSAKRLLVELSMEPVRMNEIVITDSAHLERLRHRYPGSTVVTRDMIEQTNSTSFTEVLRSLVPTLALYNIRAKSKRSTVPPRINLLIDGRPVVPGPADVYDDQDWMDKYILPQEIEYMIVHKGANAWIMTGKRGQTLDYVIEIKTREPMR